MEELKNMKMVLRRTYGSNIKQAAISDKTVVAVNNQGRIEEYVDGSFRRTFGNNITSVQISGDTVSATNAQNRIEEYVNGSFRRTY